MNALYDVLAQEHRRTDLRAANALLGKLIQQNQYVGEVCSLGYEYALVQIHDYHRQQVGGIPSLSFLVATRVNPEDEELEYTLEDSSVILLRVIDAAALPDDDEALRVRVQSAQRVSGDIETHWDSQDAMDAATHNVLSYAGVRCRVIGTFYLERDADPSSDTSSDAMLGLRFGSDISNYYPNRGLKVYKPNDEALQAIVNYRDPAHREDLRNRREVQIGAIRYASTNRSFQGVSNVRVSIAPVDLLGQKSALFGMTRTGKSNTTKILAKSVFELRFEAVHPLRVGQIIFDPNGEYANENAQDNNDALKNVWRTHHAGKREDVVTYGILAHVNDPDRRLMLLNFYTDENLQVGKEIIDGVLAGDGAKYIQNFRQVVFEPPENMRSGEGVRYRRRVLAYRALLAKARFMAPSEVSRSTKGLFNQKLLDALREYGGDDAARYQSAAKVFSSGSPSWDQLAVAFEALANFTKEKEYKQFEDWYISQ